MNLRGQEFVLIPGGSLSGFETGPGLRAAFRELAAPASIVLAAKRDEPPNCGDDHITAVNLTREITPGDPGAPRALQTVVDALRASARPEVADAVAAVELQPLRIRLTCAPNGGLGCARRARAVHWRYNQQLRVWTELREHPHVLH